MSTLILLIPSILTSMAAGVEPDSPVAGEAVLPQLVGNPAAEVERCRRAWSRGGEVSGVVEVTLFLDARGRVTGMTTPANSDPQAAQAAQCAVLGLRYEPAVRDGQPVPGSLVVPIGFITPPAVTRNPEYFEWRRCYKDSWRNEGLEGRVDVQFTLDASGKLLSHEIPPDTEPWLAEAADCLIRRYRFKAGLNRGVPVQTSGTLPMTFHVTRVRTEVFAETWAPTISGLKRRMPDRTQPSPAATDEEIVAAYRACYPVDHGGSAEVTYEITVGVKGDVQEVELVRGSGDERLDAAGACILRRLRFHPAMINRHAVESIVNWPILVRQPP